MTGRSVLWPVYRPHPTHCSVENIVRLVVGRVAPGSLAVKDFDSLQPPRVRLGNNAAVWNVGHGRKVTDGKRLRTRTGRGPPAFPHRTMRSAPTSNQEPMNEETNTANVVNSSATNGSAGCFRVERDEAGTASITFDPAAWRKSHRDMMAECTKRGMARKAAEGGLNGPAPLGYVNKREGKRAWVEIDPVVGPLVREAFDLAATGKYSVRKVHDLMVGKGLRNRNGNPLSVSGFYGVLSNHFYAGLLTGTGPHLLGNHDALVDLLTFTLAQKALSKAKRPSTSRQT